MGQAKDLMKEVPQAGSGLNGLFVNEGIELSAIIHILWIMEGPPGRTLWDMFGMAKHLIEVKYYEQFPHGPTWSSRGVASYFQRTL